TAPAAAGERRSLRASPGRDPGARRGLRAAGRRDGDRPPPGPALDRRGRLRLSFRAEPAPVGARRGARHGAHHAALRRRTPGEGAAGNPRRRRDRGDGGAGLSGATLPEATRPPAAGRDLLRGGLRDAAVPVAPPSLGAVW